MLFLVVFGAANLNSQVRIGGDEMPYAAVVLDLNEDDTNTGTKGLALPRVNFSTNTAQITSGVANLTGMLVYNTNTTLGVGVYYWDAAKWVKISDGSFVEVDGIVGNEVTNATTGGGLVRAGSGTVVDPYTLGIAARGVDTSKMKTMSVNNAILVSTTLGWRTARNREVYRSVRSTPTGTLRLDTVDASTCLTTPIIRIVGGTVGVPLYEQSGVPYVYRHTSPDPNTRVVSASCLALD